MSTKNVKEKASDKSKDSAAASASESVAEEASTAASTPDGALVVSGPERKHHKVCVCIYPRMFTNGCDGGTLLRQRVCATHGLV